MGRTLRHTNKYTAGVACKRKPINNWFFFLSFFVALFRPILPINNWKTAENPARKAVESYSMLLWFFSLTYWKGGRKRTWTGGKGEHWTDWKNRLQKGRSICVRRVVTSLLTADHRASNRPFAFAEISSCAGFLPSVSRRSLLSIPRWETRSRLCFRPPKGCVGHLSYIIIAYAFVSSRHVLAHCIVADFFADLMDG